MRGFRRRRDTSRSRYIAVLLSLSGNSDPRNKMLIIYPIYFLFPLQPWSAFLHISGSSTIAWVCILISMSRSDGETIIDIVVATPVPSGVNFKF